MFFMKLTLSLFDSGVFLLFNKEYELNLQRNHKSNREKVSLSLNKFNDFLKKKRINKNHDDLDKSLEYFIDSKKGGLEAF